MRKRELLRLVWQNITQNKFKTVMTSIGIIVGAATIVMVIAIGKGGQMDVEDQFKNLNAGHVTDAGRWRNAGYAANARRRRNAGYVANAGRWRNAR